jgi:EAL domain-containing protein (putative c-di-GMP-specific phosphodiesterase class I)
MQLRPDAPAGPADLVDGRGSDEDDRDTVRRVLEIARRHLGMDVAWASELAGDAQVFTHVASAQPGQGPQEGASAELVGSYCVRVLDGRLPAVVTDARAHSETRDLAVTQALDIGSYVGIPVRRADGQVHGMLCLTSSSPDASLAARDLTVVEMLASIIGELSAPSRALEAERLVTQAQVLEAIEGVGRRCVLQPVVDIRTGRSIGVEALARFDTAPHRPDAWFDHAGTVGLRVPLELAAARTALQRLAEPGHTGLLGINLSPEAILSAEFAGLMAEVERDRVVVEITEHAPVLDYAELMTALRPHREAGLQLAIDDAGAGYASFRHVLWLEPDFIKADLSLVRDINLHPVRQALAASLVAFARTAGAALIAEGVETQAELDTLARLGVTLMQGYLLGRPSEAPQVDGFPRPSRHILINSSAELSVVLAEAVQAGPDLEGLTRPLLDAVLSATGLETSYLMVLHGTSEFEHRYVRNAGDLELPEGFTVPYAGSMDWVMREKGLLWTSNAQHDLAESRSAARMGVRTFLSAPLVDGAGRLLGTLCAGSREAVFLSDATVAQVLLIAHVLTGELSRQVPLPPA